ncbi:MAG: hypothetical protein A2V88_13970 [Elusimicrobia bacterium RBG_16_66_12]|nr:MAG: hypothetical protein A2V88_13970 [Elusimicrobia bacterium RBG_16_66_12]
MKREEHIMPQQSSQAPAPGRELAKRPVTALQVGGYAPEDLARDVNALVAIRQIAHVTFNPAELRQVPPWLKPRISIEMINPEPNAGDVYQREGVRCLHKTALDRLAVARGINWVPERSGLRSNPRDIDNVVVCATGIVRDLSGEERTIYGEAQWSYEKAYAKYFAEKSHKSYLSNCRDNPPLTREEYGAKRATEEREYALERTESRAKNRAIRQACVIRAGYPANELSKPFIIASVQLNPDYDDPAFQAAMRERALSSLGSMFGGGPPSLPQGREGMLRELPPPMQAPAISEDDEEREIEGVAEGQIQPADVFASEAAPEDSRVANLIGLGMEVGVDADGILTAIRRLWPDLDGDMTRLDDDQYRALIGHLEARRTRS